MAINSSEYKSLMRNSVDVILDLSRNGVANIFYTEFWEKLDEIRAKHKKIKSEWELFRTYPRHDTAILKEAIFVMLELCEKWGIDPTFPFPNNVGLNEETWEDFRKVRYIARYFYKGVEITKIIEF